MVLLLIKFYLKHYFLDSLSLSAGSGTIVVINPKLAATQKLSDWYKTNMCEEFTSLSITSTSSTFGRVYFNPFNN